MIKLWLDDVRTAPEGWRWVKTAEEAFELFLSGEVEEASLDHDLGRKSSGYDLLVWIEEALHEGRMSELPSIKVHSMNPVGKANMMKAIEAIKRQRSKGNG